MIHKTPFGLLKSPPRADRMRIDAVQRALSWCETILAGSLWTPGGQEEEREDGVVGGVGLRQDLAYLYPGG